MGFSRQEYWQGQPFPFPENFPNPGIKPRSPTLQAGSLASKSSGKLFLSSVLREKLKLNNLEGMGARRNSECKGTAHTALHVLRSKSQIRVAPETTKDEIPGGGQLYVVGTQGRGESQDMCMCVCVSHSVMSNYLRPHGLQPAMPFCPQNFPNKNTGVGFHFLLQGIFPTQGLNSCLLHCSQILYHLSYQGSPGDKIQQVIISMMVAEALEEGEYIKTLFPDENPIGSSAG